MPATTAAAATSRGTPGAADGCAVGHLVVGCEEGEGGRDEGGGWRVEGEVGNGYEVV